MKNDIVGLIEQASAVAGSDNKLAKLIETTQPTISEWRSGKRSCPPADVALMAQIAGLDPDEWMARAVMAKYEGTPKGDKLMQALKVGRVAALNAAEPARAALIAITDQMSDDQDEAKQGILAVLNAFPPEDEKLKSKRKARRSTRRG